MMGSLGCAFLSETTQRRMGGRHVFCSFVNCRWIRQWGFETLFDHVREREREREKEKAQQTYMIYGPSGYLF